MASIARTHLDWVYSCALRQVRDPHLAEDVTQAVFLILAHKRPRLPSEDAMVARLFRTARYAAANALKMAARRRHHERLAAVMRPGAAQAEAAWEQIAPLLEEAIAGLGERDRRAVMLRFFRGKSTAELALALGMSQKAARTRLSRALDKLRKFFQARGLAIPASSLAAVMGAEAVRAAPPEVGASIVSVGSGAVAGAGVVAIVRGAMTMMLLIKLRAVTAYIALFAGTALIAGVLAAQMGPPSAGRQRFQPPGVAQPVAGEPLTREQLLARAEAKFTTIHDFTVTCIETNDSPEAIRRSRNTVILKPGRIYRDHFFGNDEQAWTARRLVAFNGSRTTLYEASGALATIRDGWISTEANTDGIDFFNMNLINPPRWPGLERVSQNLVAILRSPTTTVHPALEAIGEHVCHVLDIPALPGSPARLWLDADRVVPLRQEYYVDGKVAVTYAVQSVKEVAPGMWFAVVGYKTAVPVFRNSPPNAPVVNATICVERIPSTRPVSSPDDMDVAIQLNSGVPDDTFDYWKHLPPGTELVDMATQDVRIVGAGTSAATQPATAIGGSPLLIPLPPAQDRQNLPRQ